MFMSYVSKFDSGIYIMFVSEIYMFVSEIYMFVSEICMFVSEIYMFVSEIYMFFCLNVFVSLHMLVSEDVCVFQKYICSIYHICVTFILNINVLVENCICSEI